MDKEYKMPEDDQGTVLFNVPFPTDMKDLKSLKAMEPIIIKQPYHIDYIHSYGQDSPFFAGLANHRMLGTMCPKCGVKYATPKGHCMDCGSQTEWFELPRQGRVHTWTTCHFGSEEFLPECPFNLALIEFDGVDSLFLTRLCGVTQDEIRVGMAVKPQFKRLSKFKPTDVYFVPA